MAVPNSLKQVKGFTRMGGDFFWCEDISLIEEQEGFNPRNYEREDVAQHIRHFADAYKRGEDLGALEVVVIDGVVYVREGHCRRRGRLLAISEGAVLGRLVVKELKGDETEGDFRILSSQNGLKLSAVERAIIYRRLINRGTSINELAIRENMTVVAVRNCLAVYDLPLSLKNSIEDGVITMTLALELFSEYGTKAVDMIDSAIQIRREEAAKSEARMREAAALGDLFDTMETDQNGFPESVAPTTNTLTIPAANSKKANAKPIETGNVIPFNREQSKVALAPKKTATPIKLTRKDLIKKPKKKSDADVEVAFRLLRDIRKAAEGKLSELAGDETSLAFMDDTVQIELENSLLNDLCKLLDK